MRRRHRGMSCRSNRAIWTCSRDLPERFGPWQTVHGRFARWAADGTFDRLFAAARTRAEVDWLVAIDSTIARAHQHTAAKEGSRNADLDAPAAD
ncbi:hypothetical protein Scani_24560 [Streptomyces caniferus]|uniref:Insertion element IS402-like domain-containing protein n=1 Tax=Streptomyces caniferus TaxID=285557 RepID=A0A640S4Z8_9ACTN|nr:hypothetical protein Scani_24560 [Streptomyces caniferus]